MITKRQIIKVDLTKQQAHAVWKNWKKENQQIYRDLMKKCDICLTDELLGIHHLDGNKTNNVLDNFQVLCFHCHREQHTKEFTVLYSDSYERELPVIEEDDALLICEPVFRMKHYLRGKR